MNTVEQILAALKAAFEVPTRRYLWTPADAITFTPAVCDKVFGDGLALLALTTINARPRFYVLRIDSSWRLDEYMAPDEAPRLQDYLDEIYDALLDQFGPVEDEDAEDGRREWPAFDDDDGTSWGRLNWPAAFDTRPHPYATGVNILAQLADRRPT